MFVDTDPQFVLPLTKESNTNHTPNFSLKPNSPAVDAGTIIDGVTSDSIGDAPDLGAYERGGVNWKAGSTLKYKLQPGK